MPKTVKLKMQLDTTIIYTVNHCQYSTSWNTNIMHKLFKLVPA